MVKIVLLLIATVFSEFASANTFSPNVDVLPMSGKLLFAGDNEPTVPPADTAEGWQNVSGKFNLNAPGWYWLKFEAQSTRESTTVMFQTNPSLEYFMLEKVGEDFVNIDQNRIFSTAEFWGDYRLKLESEAARHFYVKVKTSRIGYATGIDYSLATPEYVLKKRIKNYLPWLIFVGVILCLIIYNSYIFFQTRDRFYLYYICTEVFLHLIHMPALVFMWNWLLPRSADYFIVTGSGLLLGYLFIFLFLSRFAKFREVMPPRIKFVVYGCSLAFIPYGVSLLIAKPVGVLLLGNIIAVLAMLGGVIYVAVKSRSRNAIILCFSFAPIPIAAAFYVVNRFLGNSNNVDSVYYLVSVLALEGVIMAIALADRIKQLEKRSREEETRRKSLEFELETAEVLQRLLLPAPLNARGFVSQPYYRPARRNGGDWFTTYLDESSETLYLVMVDVTGHGLTSAMLASFVSGTVMGELQDSNKVEEPELKLNRLASKVNQTLLTTAYKSGLVATGLFCAIQRGTGRLTFINCGHPPLAIGNSEGFEFIPASGRRLGLESKIDFQVNALQLTTSGRIFIYTDGLTENQGASGKTLTPKRLLRLLAESRLHTPESVSKVIQSTIEALWGPDGDRDDTTFLVVDWA